MEQTLTQKLYQSEVMAAFGHMERLHGRTPLIEFGKVHSDGFDVIIYAKMDTLNPGGSFKDRGSEYFIHKAVKEGRLKQGDYVVTASAGNHAKGVAKAAKKYGLNAVIFMAENTPANKIEGTKSLDAKVVLGGKDYHEAAKNATSYAKDNGFVYIPAFEHPDIVLGQSSVTTEAMVQLYAKSIRPDFFVFPFGGGGLATGGGFALDFFDKANNYAIGGYARNVRAYGVQAENYNTMFRSFREGEIVDYIDKGPTIADGIKVAKASAQMLELAKRHLDDMFDVTEGQIKSAIRRVYHSDMLNMIRQMPHEERMGKFGFQENHVKTVSDINIVEGAAASAFACAFAEDKIPYEQIAREVREVNRNRKTIVGVVIASGNNIEKTLLEDILSETNY